MKLDRILGIGGQGLVLKDEVDIKKYKRGILQEEKKQVAVKYVEFVKKNENFNDLEETKEEADWGGISENSRFVKSPYFKKLRHDLGDFKAATNKNGGYVTPFIDFGISEIYKKHYFVIGQPL